MFPTIVQRLAACAAQSGFDRLSANVVDQCKRILLDSIGCAVAAIDKPKDSASIETLNGNGGVLGRPVAIEYQDNGTSLPRAVNRGKHAWAAGRSDVAVVGLVPRDVGSQQSISGKLKMPMWVAVSAPKRSQ